MNTVRSFLYTLTVLSLLALPVARAEDPADMEAMIYVLNEEIAKLKEQLGTLEKKVAAVDAPAMKKAPASVSLGEDIVLGGQGAVAYFDTEPEGQFPNNEFRADDMWLTLDARLAENVFFFGQVLIYQRESNDQNLRMGELYLDFEDISRLWSREYPLTLRVGRFDIPYGEEYITRDPLKNALISHSLADFWGTDEGVELFGSAGPFDYAFAVQNGGYDSIKDGDPDKSLVGRVGVQAMDNLRISASAMRTGDIDIENDECTEMWFGNSYLYSLGGAETTEEFSYDMAQLDARLTWEGGHAIGSVGTIAYKDDDTAAEHDNDAAYYSVEASQDLFTKWFAAARYSAVHSSDGFPVLGQAGYNPVFTDLLVDDIYRLSLGVGYRWSDQIVLKTEYSLERGDRTDGGDLDEQDQFAAQAAFGF